MTFNLDAVLAEETGAPFSFTFGGEDYDLPPHVDLMVVAAMQDSRLGDGLRKLLGPKQWERMQASEATFDERALTALLEAYMAHVGTTVGESSASTSS